jgi:sulfate transport system substrate-binding protein
VSVVDKVVDKRGTRQVAQAYLQYSLHRGRAGDRRPRTATRPRLKKVADRHANTFPPAASFHHRPAIRWLAKRPEKRAFADGGVFDQIYQPGK